MSVRGTHQLRNNYIPINIYMSRKKWNYSCNFTAWHQECCTKTRFKIFESFRIPL